MICSECSTHIENPFPAQVTCCKACGRERTIRLKREKRRTEVFQNVVPRRCPVCGAIYKTARSNQNVCSKKCAERVVNERRKEKRKKHAQPAEKFKPVYETRKCRDCGKDSGYNVRCPRCWALIRIANGVEGGYCPTVYSGRGTERCY